MTRVSTEQTQVEHYECCHRLLPLYTNIEAFSDILHVLGFLQSGQPGTVKQIYLEEVFEDSEDETTEMHCVKILNGELFCFCNIQTRD